MTKAQAKAKIRKALGNIEQIIVNEPIDGIGEEERKALKNAFFGMVEGMSCGDMFAVLVDE